MKEKVKFLIASHFGLEVQMKENYPFTNYNVITPTGKVVAVIPVHFTNGKATTVALSSGFGGADCPLRNAIDTVS